MNGFAENAADQADEENIHMQVHDADDDDNGEDPDAIIEQVQAQDYSNRFKY